MIKFDSIFSKNFKEFHAEHNGYEINIYREPEGHYSITIEELSSGNYIYDETWGSRGDILESAIDFMLEKNTFLEN